MRYLIGLLALTAHLAYAAPYKIAVVDTGLDIRDARFTAVLCPTGHKDFTGEGLTDRNGHGTHVAGLIKSYAGEANYCLLILKYYKEEENGEINSDRLDQALAYAIKQGASIVNYSGGGPNPSEDERTTIAQAPNVLFVVAAGNNGQDLDDPAYAFYPASYRLPNILPVGNMDRDGHIHYSSNYGAIIRSWEVGVNVSSTLPGGYYGNMTGTSQACAIHTGKVIHDRFKSR